MTKDNISSETMTRLFGDDLDPVRIGGYTFGGSVDVGWTFDRLIDVFMIKKGTYRNKFDIQDWAERKASDAPTLLSAIPRFLTESILHTRFYPWLGKRMYADRWVVYAFFIGKSILNAATLDWAMVSLRSVDVGK